MTNEVAGTTSGHSDIANLSHHSHSKLQGWSYAVLVHSMGGSHHHIGASVGSHLPEIQQHGQSWRFVHVCGRPWRMGTGEQAYHEQVWSVTLTLANVKGMVGRPHDRYIQACEGFDQSPASCHAAAPSSWWPWWPADAADQGCGWWVVRGLYCAHTHASPAVPCFMGAQWEVVCCMAQPDDHCYLHHAPNSRSGLLPRPRRPTEGLGTARCRDGAWQESKGWPSPPHGWRASSYGLSIMPLMVVKVKVLVCNYAIL